MAASQDVDMPPPLQSLPTSKERKYDRQLRLWAASGQAALEQAHVLLINSGTGVAGIEALKNLVLPGIGNFTIQDSSIVAEADLGVNFFLDRHSVGHFRAQKCCAHLQELNPDVSGHAISEPVDTWLASDDCLDTYTLIMVTSPIKTDLLAHITTHCKSNAIPLLYVHSVGFQSQISLALPPAFPIVDTHPDPASMVDMRLLSPWPELQTLMHEKTHDLKDLPAHELGHVPYVLLLLHYLEQWRQTHDGRNPTAYKEKSEFRDVVRKAGPPDEENFAEACAAVLKSLDPSKAPSSAIDILNSPEARDLSAESASFWYIAAAVYAFYTQNAQLPLPGALPDMKAVSADYIALQKLYKNKARQDVDQVTATVRELESRHGRHAEHAVPVSEIEAFCKSAAHIKLVRGSFNPIEQVQHPMNWSPEIAKSLLRQCSMDSSLLVLYISFLAYDVFVNTHSVDDFGSAPRVPGSSDLNLDSDAQKLTTTSHAILDAIIESAGTFMENPAYDETKTSLENRCREITRAGGAELHNVASLTGGLIAQEIIKVVTKQYVPIDNVCLFDGVFSKTGILKV